MTRWTPAAAVFVVAVASLLPSGTVLAATIKVDTTADENTLDNGRCALREAMQAAASNSVGGTGCVAQGAFTVTDTVNLPAGTYVLTGAAGEDSNEEGDLDVGTGRVFLDHTGTKPAIIDGNGSDRVFHVLAGGALEIRGLTIQNGNAGADAGGGIRVLGFLGADGVAVTDSRATLGGGISIGGGASFFVANSTISGNRSFDTGGGLHNAGQGDVSNTTITNNIADADGAGSQGGGGVRLLTTLNLHDNVIAGNRDGDPDPVNAPDCSTTNPAFFHSEEDNLIQVPCPGAAPAPGDILGVGAKLGPLQSNGGPTPTHALLAGSMAIDAGGPLPNCPKQDQRFAPRESPCDLGAYERVKCAGKLVNRVGTGGNEKLRGSLFKDGILGLGGNDVLIGLGSGDGLCGGTGRDRLIGGPGADVLLGQGGRDVLLGGRGFDRLRGGTGRDRLRQ